MRFRLTRPALRDLAGIGQYTRDHWGEDQALYYRSAMSARLKWLCRNKPLWHERPELGGGIFTYPQQRHVIVFREYGGGIEILRVLHQRMDTLRNSPENDNDPSGT